MSSAKTWRRTNYQKPENEDICECGSTKSLKLIPT